ncbi:MULTISPECIES: clan AA aspartic protease [unclassified Microcoleus]|uniref:clan AA aspartic protease n=1 Tax=unclassified Microcoleus TaxID=2642155 RepID=UPI001D65210A|nr:MULTISPECIES: clan AA aspartic protease [unclassified Microcoleus]MCC3524065.1 clan AA aspartic protease [Microcoleus sp. PH2017_20_SFW_D_A]MCC3554405.1 clan AA aspartic protease [Microcoleus sp. PH2017_35_SFW_U_B]TAG91769.1 MAG: clan AA aspartic protease [Oscillatoriales cyanobacterium]
MINCDRIQISKNMGAVRVKVKLTNAIDEELVKRGLLNPNLLRVYEAEALIDTGAVRTAIPLEVCEHLGLRIRSQEIAKYADGRQETVGLTGPILIEMEGRETIEAAMVLGDSVLIGQTVLETLDLLVDCKNQRLVPNPENPERPVLRV